MRPFSITVPEEILTDLKKRIAECRWPDRIDATEWELGVSLDYLKDLAAYWVAEFDWRKTETEINSFPNFIASIDGFDIHYLHIKSKSPNAIPLIISHGWPGSFLEMLKVIPLLTADEDVSFDVIIPSLIGFGFSSKPNAMGVNAGLMARLWVKLMHELGYEKFIAQGGDFGAMISTHMALKYAGSIIALHLNYIPFNYKPYLPPGEELTSEESDEQKNMGTFFMNEGGYAAIQSTKPLTLSYGLNDSPVGLCAWILQAFKSFSDPSASPEDLFERDELLAHITLYWITQTMESSMRLYVAMKSEPLNFGKDDFVKVPVGIAHYSFPKSFPAKKYVERGYNVQHWQEMPKGGHFAAMEQPELFARNLKEFASTLG